MHLVHKRLDVGRQDRVIDHLVEDQLIAATEAEELRSTHGDTAATALLVDDRVDEDSLLQHLAVAFDCPPAGYGDGLYVERAVFDELDTELVRKYEIIPVRRRAHERVDVIVVEPLNEMARKILEEQFDTPVRQYIWPRVRYLQARHFFVGDPLPDSVRDYIRDHPVTFGYATPEDEIDVHRALRDSTSLHVHQWSRSDVRNFIANCYDRDTLLKVLLGFAGHWLTNRLIVVFGKEGIQPYFVEEWPQLDEHVDDLDALRALRVDSAGNSPIRTQDAWQSGSCGDLGLGELFDKLDVTPPELLASFPLQLGGRNAMSLIGVPTDRSAAVRLDELSDDFDLEPLVEATDWVGDQLEAMIKRAKQDTLPPPADRVPALPKPKSQLGLGFEDSLVEQEIARRQNNQSRHRWEIVDISHVIEESSAADEQDNAEASTPLEEPSDADEKRQFADASAPLEESSYTDDEQPIADASTPLEESSESADASEALVEASQPLEIEGQPSSSVVEVVADALGSDESSTSQTTSQQAPSSESESVSDDDATSTESTDSNVSDGRASPETDVGATSYGMPTADIPESSDALVNATDSETQSTANDEVNADIGDVDSDAGLASGSSDVSDGWSDVLHEVSEHRLQDGESSSPTSDAKSDDDTGEGQSVEAGGVGDDPSKTVEQHDFTDGGDATNDEPQDADSGDGPSGLSIPTGPSGVPMAQILRRPNRASEDATAPASASSGDDEQSSAGANGTTGRTMMGLGEIPSLADDSNIDSEADDDAELAAGTSASLAGADSRPGGTVQMDADSARTQTFGEFLDDMESEHIQEEASDAFDDDPLTVPVDAIEELESGPMAVEIEESLALLDSPAKDEAFAAAEHLATVGTSVLPKLDDPFPGRLFVDRYQYSVDTLPAVNDHGPVLEALVRIGTPSLGLVDKYLDANSLECRFYATYLLTELPAEPLLETLSQRLFDRDQQTRKIARDIIYAHRHIEDFEEQVIESLRAVLADSSEESRVEIAADCVRLFKDIASVPLLIEHLQGHSEPVRDAVHRALREITFQSLAPSPSEWRRWWFDADGQPRWKWLVDAMDSEYKEMRLLAFDEIEQLPGVDIDYHPEQPTKLRGRAQQQLTELFEQQQNS